MAENNVKILLRKLRKHIENDRKTSNDYAEEGDLNKKPIPLTLYRKEYEIDLPKTSLQTCDYMKRHLQAVNKNECCTSGHDICSNKLVVLDFPSFTLLDAFLAALLHFADRNSYPVHNVVLHDSNKFQSYSAACLLSAEELQRHCEKFILDNLKPGEFHRCVVAAEKFNRPEFLEALFRWLCYNYDYHSDRNSNNFNADMNSSHETINERNLLEFETTKIICGKNTLACAQFASIIRKDIIQKRVFFAPLDRNDGTARTCFVLRKHGMGPENQTHFILKEEGTNEIIISASSVPGSNDFIFSCSYPTDFSTSNPDYLACLSCNFVGTTFIINDYGILPKNPVSKSFPECIRGEHGAIRYDQNVLGRVPNAMTVLIPFFSGEAQPVCASESLTSRLAKVHFNGLVQLHTAKPIWREGINSWTLDFGGRVKIPSKKNFKIKRPAEFGGTKDTDWVMLFGKVTKNRFSLDYKAPLSVVQAFSIALTSFADKLIVT